MRDATQYDFIGFEKSRTKTKKYDALLRDRRTGQNRRVAFGSRKPLYEQFRDSTGLGLYKHLDHNDKERQRLYKIRHAKTALKKYSPSWFSMKYLWS